MSVMHIAAAATLGGLVSAGVSLSGAANAPAQGTAQSCNPDGDLEFVCGPRNAEDLVHLVDTPWVITSGEGLHLINVEDRTWQVPNIEYLPEDAAIPYPYEACPSPLRPGERFVHGISIRQGDHGMHELYAVNHVGRESVEVYDLDSTEGVPSLRWKGCITLPETLYGNAVSPLPDGGLAISISYEKSDPRLMEKMMAGEVTGQALEWFPGKRLKKVPGSELSANNGIAASSDGDWLYINSSGQSTLTRLPRSGVDPSDRGAMQRKTIRMPFSLPDNIRWTPGGTLLVAGHAQPLEYASECAEHRDRVCQLDYAIAEVDPISMEIIKVREGNGSSVFGGVTSAIQVDNELWLGTLRGNRVGILALGTDGRGSIRLPASQNGPASLTKPKATRDHVRSLAAARSESSSIH